MLLKDFSPPLSLNKIILLLLSRNDKSLVLWDVRAASTHIIVSTF